MHYDRARSKHHAMASVRCVFVCELSAWISSCGITDTVVILFPAHSVLRNGFDHLERILPFSQCSNCWGYRGFDFPLLELTTHFKWTSSDPHFQAPQPYNFLSRCNLTPTSFGTIRALAVLSADVVLVTTNCTICTTNSAVCLELVTGYIERTRIASYSISSVPKKACLFMWWWDVKLSFPNLPSAYVPFV